MSEGSTVRVRTVAWCLLLVIDVLILVDAFMTRDTPSTILSAVMAFVVVKTSKTIPIPKVYQDRGVTEEMFSGKKWVSGKGAAQKDTSGE